MSSSGDSPGGSERGPEPAVARLEFTVGAADTATAQGSGDVDVLATPRLLAWCEAATVLAAGDLGPGRTSVGTRVELEHRRPSPRGARVSVEARLIHRDGRLLRFEVHAEHLSTGADGPESGREGASAGDGGADPVAIAHGQVTRVVVDRDRFPGG